MRKDRRGRATPQVEKAKPRFRRRVTESESSDPPVIPSPRLPISSSPNSFRPSKRLGQNFLVDSRFIEGIVDAVGARSDETIIEIGPGKGALTDRLVEQAGQVVGIEFDNRLGPSLAYRLASTKRFKLVPGDALSIDFCVEISPATTSRVVANLPFNISTAILTRLVDQRSCISEMVLMLQREVVDRIAAPPGSGDRGYLSVVVQAYCEVEKLFDVPPTSFRPVPKVWSTVVRLRVRKQPPVEGVDEEVLWSIVSAGFAQRRKTMLNNLRRAPGPLQERLKAHGGASIVLCVANVDLHRRAETLTLDEWIRIARAAQ